MTTWTCKRCFLPTSADHTVHDCIAALRRALSASHDAVKQISALVQEMRGGQPVKHRDSVGDVRSVRVWPPDLRTNKAPLKIGDFVYGKNDVGNVEYVRRIIGYQPLEQRHAYYASRGNEPAWLFEYPNQHVGGGHPKGWDFECDLVRA